MGVGIRVRPVARIAVGAVLVAAISLLGLLVVNLFADLLAHRGAYESAGRLLPLLAVLGFAGFIGCSVALLARSPG